MRLDLPELLSTTACDDADPVLTLPKLTFDGLTAKLSAGSVCPQKKTEEKESGYLR